MKDVPALEPLGFLNLLQADDAGVVRSRQVILTRVYVRKTIQLVDELPRLEEELDGFTQADEGVDDLPQEVQWELLP